jgi:Mn2+/Fe2+ NRAMP family transporter
VNPRWLKVLSWLVAWVILGLNAYLLILTFRGWTQGSG